MLAENDKDLLNHLLPATAHSGSGSTSGTSKRARRTKACKQCHALKVRCTPLNENDPYLPCVRCSNAGKVCEIDADQLRKRRRRTGQGESVADLQDQIAELKEQLRQLNAQLAQAQHGQWGSKTPHSTASPGGASQPNGTPLTHGSPSEGDLPFFVLKTDLEREITMLTENASKLSDITGIIKERSSHRKGHLRTNQVRDVVSAGIISKEEAAARVERYKNEVFRRHPFVEVPDSLSTDQLREEMPFLFNTVVSVASLVLNEKIDEDKCLRLEIFAIEAVCNEIMVWGSKSVELVKSLILLLIWYNAPEFFKERRYHILNSVAVSLLHDLGIVSRPSFGYLNESKSIFKLPEEDNSLEYRSLIMVLYVSLVSICMILRRNIYVQWTPYVNECCVLLENDSEERFRRLALFLRLNHQLERIHHIVHANDVENKSNVSKYVIAEFQNILTGLKTKINPENHLAKAYYHSVEAYLHQPDFADVQFINKDGTGCAQKLDTNTLKAISQCTVSCLRTLDEVALLQPADIAALPLLFSSRIIYTAGMLIRMRYLILSLPSHIEKDLVPRYAVQSIQKLKKLVDITSTSYPANNFLLKMRLILQLFIQTYVTQVLDLLRSHNETPHQFKPVSKEISRKERKQLAKLATDLYNVGGGVMTTNSGPYPAPAMHLDLLSYAASFRRQSDDQGKNGVKKEQDSHKNGDAPPPQTNNNHINPPVPPNPSNFLVQPMNINNHTMMPGPTYGRNSIGSNTVPVSGFAPQGTFRIEQNSQTPSVFSNNNNMMLNPTMTTQEENPPFQGMADVEEMDRVLGKDPFHSINEEFWSNLLSADSNKIHFAQDMPGPNDEIFFMN